MLYSTIDSSNHPIIYKRRGSTVHSMSMHTSRSLAQVERAGPAFISALGIVTAAVSVSHIFAIGEPVFGIVFSAITTSLGLGLVYSGYWLSAQSDYAPLWTNRSSDPRWNRLNPRRARPDGVLSTR